MTKFFKNLRGSNVVLVDFLSEFPNGSGCRVLSVNMYIPSESSNHDLNNVEYMINSHSGEINKEVDFSYED